MTKRYSSAIKERTPRPRSKRLRDTTGGGVIGGGTSITGGSGESGGGGDGHSHANLYHLNRITTSGKYIEIDGEKAQVGLADEATHAANADNAKEAAHAQNADEAQHALNADEAEHAINADEAEHAKNADEAEHAKEADNAIRWYGHFWDDWMNQAVRTGDMVQFAGLNVTGDALVGGSVRSSVFRSGIMTGEGWKIGADGAGELESLVLRSFLEVPELRYNRVTVESGTSWNAPGAGKVLAVGSDERGDYLLLKLEEGEVGSFAKDDICMGVWHYTDETLKHFNATDEDAAADNNGLTVSGFATVYFYVTDHPEDYELDGVTYTNGKVRFAIRTTGSYSDNILKPMKAMAIVAYGNFTNESRQKSVYRTRTFTRFLMKQNTWDITYRNVAMQLGDVSGLSIPLKDGSFADLSGYSAYLNNVFFSGHIEELDIADLTDESGLLDAKNYSVELSCYVDEVTLGNDGAVIGGLWNEDTAEDGGVVRKYRFQTAVTARRNGELLLDNGREKPRTGFYRLTAVGKGCDCFVRNSTVYVSGIDGVKVDGELSDDEKERMLKLESCSVDLTVECEGGAVITKTYTITIKHSTAPTISENGYWIIEGVETEFSAVGDDGHTPYIGDDGCWYEWDPDLNEGKGDYHSTGIKAKGENGSTPTISENGYWIIEGVETDFSAVGDDGHAPVIVNGYWYEWDPDFGAEGGYMPTGIKAKGEDGLSAYEIYKKSGGNLSESGWLESLVGPKGLSAYEVYKKNGGSLSESAWLESLDGEPGLSAYDIYIANGGTLSEKGWLESLVGPKGLSAYEVYKKNGGTLSEVAWLESLDGEPGLSAYDIYIANGGTLSEKGWLESLKGNPGTKGALVRFCGEWNASVTYVNDDHFVDVVMYGGGYRKLADGKASNRGTSPSSSGDNSTWVVFSNFKALAASVILANSGYVDILGAGAMFIGVNSNGVTHNSDGSTSLSSTAKGWVITNGSIYYIENGQAGLQLTKDGKLSIPSGCLSFKVGSVTYTDLGTAILDNIPDGETGINENLLKDPLMMTKRLKQDAYGNVTDVSVSGGSYYTVVHKDLDARYVTNPLGEGGHLYRATVSGNSIGTNKYTYPKGFGTLSDTQKYGVKLKPDTDYTFSVWIRVGTQSFYDALTSFAQINLYKSVNGTLVNGLENRVLIGVGKSSKVEKTVGGYTQFYYTFNTGKIPKGYVRTNGSAYTAKDYYTGNDFLWFVWFPFFTLANDSTANGQVDIAGVKLEEGTTATPFNRSVNALLATGIDIENRKLSVTADQFEIKDNGGIVNVWVDDDGNFVTRGVQQCLITEVNASNFNKKCIAYDADSFRYDIAASSSYIDNSDYDYTDKGTYLELEGRSLDVLCIGDIVNLNYISGTRLWLPHITKAITVTNTGGKHTNSYDGVYFARTWTRNRGGLHQITFDEMRHLIGKRVTILNKTNTTVYLMIGHLLERLRYGSAGYWDECHQNTIGGEIYHGYYDSATESFYDPSVGVAIMRNGGYVTLECQEFTTISEVKSAWKFGYCHCIGWKILDKGWADNRYGDSLIGTESSWNGMTITKV